MLKDLLVSYIFEPDFTIVSISFNDTFLLLLLPIALNHLLHCLELAVAPFLTRPLSNVATPNLNDL